MKKFPFKQKKLTKNALLREFSSDGDSEELIWHRDHQDRSVFVLESGGWRLQKDDELPVLLEEGSQYFIEAGSWHRVIKGDGKLLVIVREKNG